MSVLEQINQIHSELFLSSFQKAVITWKFNNFAIKKFFSALKTWLNMNFFQRRPFFLIPLNSIGCWPFWRTDGYKKRAKSYCKIKNGSLLIKVVDGKGQHTTGGVVREYNIKSAQHRPGGDILTNWATRLTHILSTITCPFSIHYLYCFINVVN